MATKIALIKTGALGDVVRTTCLLPALHRVFPGLELTWITSSEALPLLKGNPNISQIVLANGLASEPWHQTAYDWVISLEDDEYCCALASSLKSQRLSGGYKVGEICRYTPDFEPWFGMGLLRPGEKGGLSRANELKRLNQESFATLLYRSLNLPLPISRPFIAISEQDVRCAARWIMDHELYSPIVALNTGASARWRYKSWGEDQTADLARALVDDLGVNVLLLGGPAEHDRNQRILGMVKRTRVVAAPVNLDLIAFTALVSRCNLIVASDSLSLHLAIVVDTRIVAFFGPTSATEIDLYGLGEKIVTPLGCHTCYLRTCDVRPNCMESISVRQLFDATARQLQIARSVPRPHGC